MMVVKKAKAAAPEKKEETTDEEKLLELARDCYTEAADYWQEYLDKANEWARFFGGEQWPADMKNARENDPNGARPCLTLDRLGQYVRQVQNDARQNRAGIRVKPVDARADVKTARIYQEIIRHTEYVSRAHLAYDHALKHSSALGLGWFRLVPVVIDEARNSQELRIKRVANWRAVLTDPDWTEPDGADMSYAFVMEEVPRKRFERENPGIETEGWEAQFPKWCTKDRLRIAEFLRVCDDTNDFVILEGGETMRGEDYKTAYSEVPDADRPIITGEATKIKSKYVSWSRLVAGAVLSETKFMSKHIPVIPVIGNEFWHDDKRHLDGMVQWGMDGQRAYNYARSSDVEVISLAPKVPWVGAVGQFAGQEKKWAAANRSNIPYLEYNPKDLNGIPIPAPQRQQPPIASGWQSIAQIAAGDIEAALGMYKASIGAPSNERSGSALRARRSESDTSTYHYVDNLSISIAHAGRIIVETMPTYFDHQRAVLLMGDDMKQSVAYVNPQLGKSYVQQPDGRRIFNPLIGKFDVAVESGPSFATKREEAAAAMIELTRGSPELIKIIGDLMIRAMDWPQADLIADRLQALLPPLIQQLEAEGDDPNAIRAKFIQAIQTLEKQQELIKAMQQQMGELQKAAEGTESKLVIEGGGLAIDGYKAETDRLKALQPMLGPAEVQAVVLSTLQQLLTSPDISPASGAPQGAPLEAPEGMMPGEEMQGAPELPGANPADEIF